MLPRPINWTLESANRFLTSWRSFLGKVDLDLVGVRGAQFHPFELRRLAVLDDSRDVPVGGQIIGDQTQMHGRPADQEAGSRRGSRARWRGYLQAQTSDSQPGGLEKVSSVEVHRWQVVTEPGVPVKEFAPPIAQAKLSLATKLRDVPSPCSRTRVS